MRIRTGRIWGPGLAELARLPRLERLCIWGNSPISDRHVQFLEGLTQLRSLTLWGICDRLTDASLASIGKLENLEELHFIRTNPRFTPAGISRLKGLKKLKQVDFAQMWAGPEGVNHGDEIVRQLAEALPHVESIKGLSYLSEDGMKTLTTFRNFKRLSIGLKDRKQNYYGPTGLAYLAGLSDLEELSISSGDTLSEADLASLESLSHLRDLTIAGPGVTDGGLASIGKLKQLERLRLSTMTRSGLNHLNGLSNLQVLQVTARGQGAKRALADELTLDLSGLGNVKDLNLSGLPLHDSDLAFLKHLSLLEHLMIQPTSPLTGRSLCYMGELLELKDFLLSGLSSCTGADLAHLNGLPKLRDLTLKGDITDSVLASLKGASSLWSLHVETDNPIRKQTVTDLAGSNPVIEYIHIKEAWKPVTRPMQQQRRSNVIQPRARPPTLAKRRRERR